MQTKNELKFFRGALTAVLACVPFWMAVGYGAYRLLKFLGY